MATVYLADDLKHHRKVAIKVLRPELGSLLGPDRFTREIRIAAALNHPHILPLYDSGEAAALLYYVMPYVRGESLRQKLVREQQLPIDEAIGITRHAASALDHAHALGLIHRDIKPENILIHEGEAMVADFGIALAAGAAPGERLTATGLMVGTPAYMSPERRIQSRLRALRAARRRAAVHGRHRADGDRQAVHRPGSAGPPPAAHGAAGRGAGPADGARPGAGRPLPVGGGIRGSAHCARRRRAPAGVRRGPSVPQPESSRTSPTTRWLMRPWDGSTC